LLQGWYHGHHDEGVKFINIEEGEEEIYRAQIDETCDYDGQKRKNVYFSALREREREIKILSLCPQ